MAPSSSSPAFPSMSFSSGGGGVKWGGGTPLRWPRRSRVAAQRASRPAAEAADGASPNLWPPETSPEAASSSSSALDEDSTRALATRLYSRDTASPRPKSAESVSVPAALSYSLLSRVCFEERIESGTFLSQPPPRLWPTETPPEAAQAEKERALLEDEDRLPGAGPTMHPGAQHAEEVRPTLNRSVHAIILAGSASRHNPLARQRAPAAVPLGASYRVIDVPISNCIHSGINMIHVLAQ